MDTARSNGTATKDTSPSESMPTIHQNMKEGAHSVHDLDSTSQPAQNSPDIDRTTPKQAEADDTLTQQLQTLTITRDGKGKDGGVQLPGRARQPNRYMAPHLRTSPTVTDSRCGGKGMGPSLLFHIHGAISLVMMCSHR